MAGPHFSGESPQGGGRTEKIDELVLVRLQTVQPVIQCFPVRCHRPLAPMLPSLYINKAGNLKEETSEDR